ncbi:MAG TPA: L28 family ribosomal protein [bacterium]
MKQCSVCGKRAAMGHSITKRGMAKKDGGVGRRNVRVNRRRFLPNLQAATVIDGGTVRKIRVCATCLRNGRVVKAPPRSSRPGA